MSTAVDALLKGDQIKRYRLGHPVISCADAVAAKGIHLRNELKSILLQTPDGVVCAHLRGDQRLSLRKVKQLLGHKDVKLLDSGIMPLLGVSPGTVTPLSPVVWRLPHIIDPTLLALAWISTNDGTLTGYVVFSPQLLLGAGDCTVERIGMP